MDLKSLEAVVNIILTVAVSLSLAALVVANAIGPSADRESE